jgi:uncharacterized protein
MDKPVADKRIFEWGHGRRFNSYSNHFRKLYGSRVQKVSIDAGFTCPNRDGTRGLGGCTYCNNDAFNPSYCTPVKSVSKQIEEGIEFHRKRYRHSDKFLAYFQAYSNTYSPLQRMKELYSEALAYPGVVGLVIGTRPDCIDDQKLEYLSVLSRGYYLALEYGVESCYDKTLKRINRGHTYKEAEEAIRKSASLGINTGAHFILGLPGESREEMLAGAGIISRLPLSMVKFHQLQIIKGTAMEREFESNPNDFELFTWDEYLEFFIRYLERLNPSIVVERFTGEAPPRFLAGPGWGKKRTDQIVNLVEKRMEELDTWQGKLYKNNSDKLVLA